MDPDQPWLNYPAGTFMGTRANWGQDMSRGGLWYVVGGPDDPHVQNPSLQPAPALGSSQPSAAHIVEPAANPPQGMAINPTYYPGGSGPAPRPPDMQRQYDETSSYIPPPGGYSDPAKEGYVAPPAPPLSVVEAGNAENTYYAAPIGMRTESHPAGTGQTDFHPGLPVMYPTSAYGAEPAAPSAAAPSAPGLAPAAAPGAAPAAAPYGGGGSAYGSTYPYPSMPGAPGGFGGGGAAPDRQFGLPFDPFAWSGAANPMPPSGPMRNYVLGELGNPGPPWAPAGPAPQEPMGQYMAPQPMEQPRIGPTPAEQQRALRTAMQVGAQIAEANMPQGPRPFTGLDYVAGRLKLNPPRGY